MHTCMHCPCASWLSARRTHLLNARDSVGTTPLMLALAYEKPVHAKYVRPKDLHATAHHMTSILLCAGADPSLTNHHGQNAIHIACLSKFGTVKSISSLVDRGADLNAQGVLNELSCR